MSLDFKTTDEAFVFAVFGAYIFFCYLIMVMIVSGSVYHNLKDRNCKYNTTYPFAKRDVIFMVLALIFSPIYLPLSSVIKFKKRP